MSKKLGIIGFGKMGKCLVQGLLNAKVYSKDQMAYSTQHTQDEVGITRFSNAQIVESCETILLAVKPQNLKEVLTPLANNWKEGATLISILAGVTTSEIEALIPKKIGVVRAMPNTPAFVRASMTALCLGKQAEAKDKSISEKIFGAVGKTLLVDEKHMEAVTGVSGCGPAYVYLMIEALIDGGIKVGLPREMAVQLASQTVLGAAKMILETNKHPAHLRDDVTTPAGCTIDGLLELEEGKVRISFIKAIVKATERAKKLKE